MVNWGRGGSLYTSGRGGSSFGSGYAGNLVSLEHVDNWDISDPIAKLAGEIATPLVMKFVQWLAPDDDKDNSETTTSMRNRQSSAGGQESPRSRKHILKKRESAVDNGKYNIAFVGNVNCGKTSLFNAFLFLSPSDSEAGEVKCPCLYLFQKRICLDRQWRSDTRAQDAYSPDLLSAGRVGLSW